MKRHLPMQHTILITIIISALAVMGCKKDQSGAEETAGAEQGVDPNAERNMDLTPADGKDAGACSLQTVYFGFDSADLTADSRAAIQQAVECYRAKSSAVRFRLTGATDPRGTEEYNIALGERRAQSVRSYLVSLGVEGDRLSVTSVGEEMASGTDESGWAQDRNVSADASQ